MGVSVRAGRKYRRSVPPSPSDATRKPFSRQRLMELKAPNCQREAQKRVSQSRVSIKTRLIEKPAADLLKRSHVHAFSRWSLEEKRLESGGGGPKKRPATSSLRPHLLLPEASLAHAGQFRVTRDRCGRPPHVRGLGGRRSCAVNRSAVFPGEVFYQPSNL